MGDSTTAADQNRRRNRKDKHEYEDDRRSQRSRRSSDSRSSPIPIPEDTMMDNRRNQRNNRNYSDRSFDNASPGMMSGSGRSHGSNFRRHDRSSGGGDGHISPQGNYNQGRNGNAAMDAPSSYRVSDYDYGEQRGGHYEKRRSGMRKSDERRSNYKSNRDYESRLDMGRQTGQQRHSGEMGRPGQMGRNGSGMRSNQRGSRDSFSPGPRDQI